ncbi:hypothetical protein JKP88DRAFT_245204 [Tribonema minus]|uniref:Uncharacterized protein n=1 Tax=Tribonema minus TaxID=303371 RepID=A0A835YZE6_9STRA|nr:hypothetical protein JKP88DRAFT_245204 [Tribonema minus]
MQEFMLKMVNELQNEIDILQNLTHPNIFENIMFESDLPDAAVKLLDFGLSARYREGEQLRSTVGTAYSMAPEVLADQMYNQACDLWSVGVVLYMMLFDKMPFAPKYTNISAKAKELVCRLMELDANKRITASQALLHKYMVWARDGAKSNRSTDGKDIMCSLQRYSSYGKMRRAALMVVAHQCSPEQIRDLRDVFTSYDTAEDGTITALELQQALLQHGMSAQQIGEIFSGVDMDNSGKLDYTEFLAATVETMGFLAEEKIMEAFNRLDEDGNGVITDMELRKLLGKDYKFEDVEAMIAEADKNRDGRIDFDEFMRLMLSTASDRRVTTSRSHNRAALDAMHRMGSGNSIMGMVSTASGSGSGSGSSNQRRRATITLRYDSGAMNDVRTWCQSRLIRASEDSCCTFVVEGALLQQPQESTKNDVDTARVALVMARTDAFYRGLSAAIHGALASTVAKAITRIRLRKKRRTSNAGCSCCLLAPRSYRVHLKLTIKYHSTRCGLFRALLGKRESVIYSSEQQGGVNKQKLDPKEAYDVEKMAANEALREVHTDAGSRQRRSVPAPLDLAAFELEALAFAAAMAAEPPLQLSDAAAPLQDVLVVGERHTVRMQHSCALRLDAEASGGGDGDGDGGGNGSNDGAAGG